MCAEQEGILAIAKVLRELVGNENDDGSVGILEGAGMTAAGDIVDAIDRLTDSVVDAIDGVAKAIRETKTAHDGEGPPEPWCPDFSNPLRGTTAAQ